MGVGDNYHYVKLGKISLTKRNWAEVMQRPRRKKKKVLRTKNDSELPVPIKSDGSRRRG